MKEKPERPRPTRAKPKRAKPPKPRIPPNPEVAQLAADVAARPDDLDLQRIYADILIEQGGEHAIRGELITLTLSGKHVKMTEPRRVKLARELEEILEGDGLEQQVVGGFVGTWSCTSQVLADRGEAVFAQEPMLRELEVQLVSNLRVQIETIGEEPGFARLRSLTLDGTELLIDYGDPWFRTLLASTHWPVLEVLRLPGCRIGDAGARAIAHSRSMRELRELDLTSNSIFSSGTVDVARSPHLRELQKLGLQHNRPSIDGARALADTEHLMKLEHLDVRDTEIRIDYLDDLRVRFKKVLRSWG